MLKIYRVLGKKEELQSPLKSVSESDSNTTMFYHSHSRMMARLLSGEKKSATTVMNLQKNSRKITPLKISSTVCLRKNREMHLFTFLCCGQKSRNTKQQGYGSVSSALDEQQNEDETKDMAEQESENFTQSM